MSGGGGGGDGGAQKMEEQRQRRVQSAIDAINAIFSGQDRVVPIGPATSFDPNSTYYNADGTRWTAPTASGQGDLVKVYRPAAAGTEPARDANGAEYGSGGAAGFGVLRPGAAETYGLDRYGREGDLRTAPLDYDAINRRIASGDLYTGTQTIKGMSRQGLYDDQRKAVTDLNRRDVDRQFLDAERQNRFGLARAGLSGGSADIDSNAELTRRTNEGLIKAAGIGDQAAADLQTADERSRQNLISMAQSGIDTGQAAQMALSQLDANSANAASARSGATVGNLFGDLAQAYLYGQQQQGARAGAAPYQQWMPGTNGNPRNSYQGS